MTDTTLPTDQSSPQSIPTDTVPQNEGIMEKTLGEVLHSNPQAQNMVMQAMHISPEKLQEMLQMTDNNPMMQTKIGDLFKNGTIQQAVMQQSSDNAVPAAIQTTPASNVPSESLLDKVKKWFVK